MFLYLFEFLAETPVVKDRLNKEKTNRSFLAPVPHVHMKDSQEKIVTP